VRVRCGPEDDRETARRCRACFRKQRVCSAAGPRVQRPTDFEQPLAARRRRRIGRRLPLLRIGPPARSGEGSSPAQRRRRNPGAQPSGIAEPSQADELITRRLREALALVDIRVLDHLIVAGGETTSVAERGLL
jgi:hypothetical protein